MADPGSEYSILYPSSDQVPAYNPARDDKFHAQYLPPPPSPPGKIFVKAPADSHGRPLCADLHLTPEQAEQLMEVLNDGLHQYLAAIDHQN